MWPKYTSFKPSNSCPSSSCADTIVRSSTENERSNEASAEGWCRTSTPGLRPRLGIDPDDRLPVEVLRHVGDEPILPGDHHDVLRPEQEPGTGTGAGRRG